MDAQAKIKNVDELLERFRQEQTSTSELGGFLEKLVCDVLLKSDYPEIQKTWLWKDWEFNDGADNGIDVVALTEDGEYWAVQCKFYDSKTVVCKENVDSFLSDGARPRSGVSFSRLLLYVTSPLSGNLKRELEGRTPPVFVRRVDRLDADDYRWDKLYRVATGERASLEELRRPKKTLKEHQQRALDDVKRGFKSSDRGKLIMACGTGKTLTSLRIAETLAPPSGVVLYLVPSLTLLAQTLSEWTFEANRKLAPVLVCSDAQIANQDSRRALVSTAKNKSKSKETQELDEASFDMLELAQPASTDPEELVARWQKINERANERDDLLTVVFSTYQSIQVISDAQRLGNASGAKFPEFDLIICDEAHRTTGVSLCGKDESAFVKVHNNDVIAGKKRLYMTATPRVYTDYAQTKAREANAELCSMDDEALFGKNFHTLNFGEAVRQNLLADYKVLIITVSEEHAQNYKSRMSVADVAKSGKIEGEVDLKDVDVDDVAKMIGCWRGLSKQSKKVDGIAQKEDDFSKDPNPMKRAVAFCRSIKDSKEFAVAFKKLNDILVKDEKKERDEENLKEALERHEAQEKTKEIERTESKSEEAPRVAELDEFSSPKAPLKVQIKHVDGTFPADERKELLTWLKNEPEENTCDVLSNVRCLSEGVDVPNLDAALFLSPRASQVDVVQAVGRVMRKADGKNFGYVIIPVVVAEGVDPNVALDNNDRYRVVWQTLQALRSHDERFHIWINQLQVGETNEHISIEVVGVGAANSGENSAIVGKSEKEDKTQEPEARQAYLPNIVFEEQTAKIKDAFHAKIVKRCGDREYLDQWARDVAKITSTRIDGIRAKLEKPTCEQQKAFDALLEALRRDVNPNIGKEQALDMVAQHLTTLPVFDALFADSAFSKNNPVAILIKETVDAFNLDLSEQEQEQERRFQESVRKQIEGIKSAKGRQAVIHKLYEQFFTVAIPKTAEKLGVVYTPPEVVDYILQSVDYVLRQEFNQRVTDEGVHILDPFTGTGAFIARLIESNLIEKEDLPRKYRKELHANEIMPLAYYIASVNIEETYCAALGEGTQYESFPGVVLTDTFQTFENNWESQRKLFEDVPTNGERLEKQRNAPITVVVGNPPYSVGQKNANDNNQNEKYPKLDARIAETYAAKSTATNKNSLYDSYIKAFRWASDRIGTQGVVAFVSNGAYIDNAAMEGFRKAIVEEFAAIYVFNLRGNARTQGELRRKEKDNVFGQGTRTPVAITVLIKKPHKGNAKIYYHDIGDYLSRDRKLNRIKELKSVEKKTLKDFEGVEREVWTEITPNELGDWINQRGGEFEKFIPLGSKGAKGEGAETTFFEPVYGRGLETARDAWTYNFSKERLFDNMRGMIDVYNEQTDAFNSLPNKPNPLDFVEKNQTKIKWTDELLRDLQNGIRHDFRKTARTASYRPFCKERLYFDDAFIHRPGNFSKKLFPTPKTPNLMICIPSVGTKGFSAIITDQIPDLEIERASQCFPLYYYEPAETATLLPTEDAKIVDGYVQRSAITDDIFEQCKAKYGLTTTKEDIFFYVYGALHSSSYRTNYANELKKELARLPLPTSNAFRACSSIGRRLANIHVNYETGKSTIRDQNGALLKPLQPASPSIRATAHDGISDAELYRVVRKMKLGVKTEKQEDGTTRKSFDGTLKYNEYLTFADIPLESFKYVVNGRSPLEWLVERYYCKEDKASGIVDDPNEWSDDPKYIFNLVPRLIAVAQETLKLTNSLPELE